MKILNTKKNYKMIILFSASLMVLMIGLFFLGLGNVKSYAQMYEISNNLISDQAYLSAHYTDGTMGMIVDETYTLDDEITTQASYANLQKTTVMSSGLSDEQSIVAVFLGDGFTVNEQQLFLDHVTEISNYMVTVEPFCYYKNYLTVYAVHRS